MTHDPRHFLCAWSRARARAEGNRRKDSPRPSLAPYRMLLGRLDYDNNRRTPADLTCAVASRSPFDRRVLPPIQCRSRRGTGIQRVFSDRRCHSETHRAALRPRLRLRPRQRFRRTSRTMTRIFTRGRFDDRVRPLRHDRRPWRQWRPGPGAQPHRTSRPSDDGTRRSPPKAERPR